MHDVMRDAVHEVLNDVAGARAAGYPERFRPPDVAAFVSSAPEVHAAGGRVRGPGWSHPLPPSWAFDPSRGERGGARSPSGTELTAALGYCIGGTARCATLHQRGLVSAGDELVERVDFDQDGSAVSQFETRRPDGTRVLVRVVGEEGVTLHMTCAAPPGAPEDELGACPQAFAGASTQVMHHRR